MEVRRADGYIGVKMQTATHRVTYTNTRSARSVRLYENITEAQILSIIKEQHSLDNGVRVYSVYHADGSKCPALEMARAS